MKKLIFVILVLTFLVGMTAIAMAGQGGGGYAGVTSSASTFTTAIGGPAHGSYATTTNQCKGCHAVHAATGTYKLLRGSSLATACNYCHANTSGLITDKFVYEGGTGASHAIGVATIPDATSNTPIGSNLDCKDCHNAAPHGAGVAANGKLTSTTNPGGAGSVAFCGNCHDKNTDIVLNTDSHIITAATDFVRNSLTVAWSNTQYCTSCHKANGEGLPADFPHSSNSTRFLKSGALSTGLANVCVDCHTSGGSYSSGDGVGRTF